MTLNRSFLFAPGNVARRVEKALTLEADAIIVDLEDSVALAEKAATRKSVAEALRRPRRGRGYVRVNAPSSELCYRDLVETLHRQVDGVVVPKIESAADLHAVDWLMANLEREFGVEPGTLDLIPQIETAAGVQRVDRILQARSLRPYKAPWRVKRVAFGGADYAHQLGLTVGMDEAELADARARVVLSSRAAGLEGPLDSPWCHFREAEGRGARACRAHRGGVPRRRGARRGRRAGRRRDDRLPGRLSRPGVD